MFGTVGDGGQAFSEQRSLETSSSSPTLELPYLVGDLSALVTGVYNFLLGGACNQRTEWVESFPQSISATEQRNLKVCPKVGYTIKDL